MTQIVLSLITFYQYIEVARKLIFKNLFHINAECKYLPTCSQYASQAIITHGLTKGLLLAGRRLGRCHPWSEGGHDPVPKKV